MIQKSIAGEWKAVPFLSLVVSFWDLLGIDQWTDPEKIGYLAIVGLLGLIE